MIFLTKHYLQSTKPGPDLEKFMVSLLYTFQVVDFQQELNDLQSNQVKRTPQDSINELIIWKMNPLVVPVTGVKFKAAFLHA